MMRKFYALAHRLTRVPELLAAKDHARDGGTTTSSADEADIIPAQESAHMKTPLLPRFHFLPQTIQDKWLPLAGSIEEIPEFRELDCKLMIMCSSRTGSEYLSYLLEDFGFHIHESFNIEPYVEQGTVPGGLPSIRDYLIQLLKSPKNRRFGVKGTGQSSLPLFIYDEWPRHAHEWKVVRLLRRNVVRQAVSLRIAEKNQAWHPGHTAQRVVEENEYCFEEILRCLENIAAVNSHIERIISLMGMTALTVFYEDLSEDPRAVTDAVGRYLEVERMGTSALEGRGSTRPNPTVRSTELNRLWEQRFREDLAAYSSAEEICGAKANE